MEYETPNYQSQTTKACKYCGMQIPYHAKKCHYCYKSQRSTQEIVLKIVGVWLLICIVGLFLGGSEDDVQDESEKTTLQDSVLQEEAEQEFGNEFTSDDMHVKYLKSKIEENAAGDKCLVLYFDFTNNSDENQSFIYSFRVKAFQNGVELDGSLMHVNEETKNKSREIQPGTTITVAKAFVLTEDMSTVMIEVEPWITFIDEKLFELEITLE